MSLSRSKGDIGIVLYPAYDLGGLYTSLPYILSLSENKTIIVVDGADEVTRQLLKIGNNINQIAIVANTSRKNESALPNYYLKRITDYQNEIMKLLKDLLLAVTKAEHESEESEKSNGG